MLAVGEDQVVIFKLILKEVRHSKGGKGEKNKYILGGGFSLCKCLEAGDGMLCLRNSKKGNVYSRTPEGQ